jgi:hypothetical protein
MTKLNRQAHLADINQAIAELAALESRTISPAPIYHQYIGTIIDNTIGLLTAPASILNSPVPRIAFSEDHNWLSLMLAVHRSFFSSIQIGLEKALCELCTTNGVKVVSKFQRTAEKAFSELVPHIAETEDAARATKNLRKIFRVGHPGFDDYLNAALDTSSLSAKDKKEWRKYFRAISILRNKTSHSDTELSDAEKTAFHDAGFGDYLSESGTLRLNSRRYCQVAVRVLNFLDAVTAP